MNVRFILLQMISNQLFFIFILLCLIFIFSELYYNQKTTLSFILLIFLIFIDFLLSNKFWHYIFFSEEIWKNLLVLIICCSFIIILSLIKRLNFEIFFLNLMVLLGSLMIITSDHLIIIYIGLELQTFSIFILISKNKNSIKSSESALKYFILGALSSGLFLLGLTFMFSLGLSLNIKELSLSLSFFQELKNIPSFLICISLFFKLALFPLHFWIADIYEGSTWEVISSIAIIPKISVLSIILQILYCSDFFLICSILSIIIGTFGAMNQTKIKRLLAYSGVSHIGFIMMGLSLITNQGYEASFIYLVIYIITMLGIFLLIYQTYLSGNYYLIELSGLSIINKLLAVSWLIFFLSISGIPPLSGFISKWLIIILLLDYKYILLSTLIVIFSAIGAGYYLRIVKISYFQKKSSFIIWEQILTKDVNNYNLLSHLLGVFIYLSIVLIFHPSILFSPFYLGFQYFF